MHYTAWPHHIFATRGTNLVLMAESFKCDLAEDDVRNLYAILSTNCLSRLPTDEKKARQDCFGGLTLLKKSPETETDDPFAAPNDEGGNWSFKDVPRTAARHALHQTILTFIAAQIEKHPDALEINQWRFQGDDQEPVAVALDTLIRNREAYNGKRVRVSGFYHTEFEHSSLSPDPAHIYDYKNSLWLGGASGIARCCDLAYTNDTFVTVEGTFNGRVGGHMGLWSGQMDRLTKIALQGENQIVEPRVPPNTRSPSALGVGGR